MNAQQSILRGESPKWRDSNVLNQKRLNEAYDDVSSGVGDDEEPESPVDPSRMQDEINNEADADNIEKLRKID